MIDEKKLDHGKTMLGYVLLGFANALEEVGKVGTYGCQKYKKGSWPEVENAHERYTDAMFRHFFNEARGEKEDSESGLMHAAHGAWNALCRLELELRASRKEE